MAIEVPVGQAEAAADHGHRVGRQLQANEYGLVAPGGGLADQIRNGVAVYLTAVAMSVLVLTIVSYAGVLRLPSLYTLHEFRLAVLP